ncbi:hypothetical protein BLNAU_11833 [Blattamonas nauphoetae]|uniref:Uncharacterized protein n=1 Tax=Blattamonas nauphoetae TaxID=2049346 RepID=A0ABQ9XPD2_9EUKA|nr:hypothetical protein BLNAU_11833 [Blattamonas nauphoetae]
MSSRHTTGNPPIDFFAWERDAQKEKELNQEQTNNLTKKQRDEQRTRSKQNKEQQEIKSAKNRPTSTKHRVLHDSRNRKSNHLTKSDMKEESSVESASTTADRRNSITRPISRSPFSSHPQTFQFLALAVQNGLSDTNSPSTNSFPAPQQLLTSSVQHVERKPHRAAVSPSPTQLHRKLRHTHPNPHLLPTRHKPLHEPRPLHTHQHPPPRHRQISFFEQSQRDDRISLAVINFYVVLVGFRQSIHTTTDTRSLSHKLFDHNTDHEQSRFGNHAFVFLNRHWESAFDGFDRADGGDHGRRAEALPTQRVAQHAEQKHNTRGEERERI